MPIDQTQRTHERLRAYWDGLRGARAYPDEDEIDAGGLADIWDQCFLAEARRAGEGAGFRYVYMGASLIEAYGYDPTAEDVRDRLVSTQSDFVSRKFAEVVATGRPVTDESEFVNANRLFIKYRTCLLPLGKRGGGVSYVLGAMRWKAY